jgi:hypothetical protein
MIDAEVVRLRKLRDIALRTRALAKVLDADSTIHNSVYARSALICWTIVRVASGRLRAHPYLNYQKGPSRRRQLAGQLSAFMTGLTVRGHDRRLAAYAQQLQSVEREVADVRALTWSPDLSDALGRTQIQMRRLAHELNIGLPEEAETIAPRVKPFVRADAGNSLDGIAAQDSWPYLAI